MALEEHDREDLLRDGRAMPIRGECQLGDVSVVIGFRSQGQLSLYCGADPVFQFNSSRELRRVFFQGVRYAAESSRLVELRRETRGGKVAFIANEISPSVQAAMLSSLYQWLAAIEAATRSQETHWRVGNVSEGEFLKILKDWFDQIAAELAIADSPNA